MSAEEQGTETIEGAVAKEGLFDGSVYDDPKLRLEHNGKRVTAIAVGFGGNVDLERWQLDDLELFKGLHEGDEVEFVVTGVVSGTAHAFRQATESRGEQLTAVRKIKVHSLEQR